MITASKMEVPETVVSLLQCRFCGSIITSSDGAERHKDQCRIVKLTKGEVLNAAGKLTVVVNFPCPIVLLERLENSHPLASESRQEEEELQGPRKRGSGRIFVKDEKFEPDFSKSEEEPAPPKAVGRRKSSLNALKKLRVWSVKNEKIKSVNDNEEGSDWDVSEGEDYQPNETFSDEDESYLSSTSTKPGRKRKGFGMGRRRSGLRVRNSGKIFFGLRCSGCPARFNSESTLERHEFVVHGEGSKDREIMTCPICGRMVHSSLIFHAHIKNHENAEGLEDDFDLWNKWPDRGRVMKSNFSASCKHCVIPLNTHHKFLEHMRQDHPDKGRDTTYTCKYCLEKLGTSEEYSSIKSLTMHFRNNHSVEFCVGNKEGIPVRCDICDKRLSDAYYLKRHKRIYHDSDSRAVKVIERPNNAFACAVKGCDAKLKTQSQLKMHVVLHLKNNPFVCPIPGCTVKMDARCHLIRHIKLHFEPGIPCKVCGVHYSRKDRLKKHKCNPKNPKSRVGELGRKANARLFDPDVLKTVAKIKKDKEVKIDVDNPPRGISDIVSLENLHRRIDINQIIATDPVFIETCKENPEFELLVLGGKRTPKRRNMIRQFKCEKCKMTFSSAKYLKDHDLKMHVPRPFKCFKCQMTYTSETHLENHVLKWHSDVDDNYMVYLENEGRFKCTKCGAIRVNEMSLMRHWFLIHKVKVEVKTRASVSELKKRMKNGRNVKRSVRKRKQKQKRNLLHADDNEDDPEWFEDLSRVGSTVEKKAKSKKGFGDFNESVPIIKVEVPESNMETESENDIKPDLTSGTSEVTTLSSDYISRGSNVEEENIKQESIEIYKVEVENFGVECE